MTESENMTPTLNPSPTDSWQKGSGVVSGDKRLRLIKFHAYRKRLCRSLTLLMLAVGSCAEPSVPSDSSNLEFAPLPSSPDSTLRASLAGEAASEQGESLWLDFILTNEGDVDLVLSSWGTPLDGRYTREFFVITRGGERVVYEGPTLKRAAPQAEDFQVLRSGATRRARLDLAEAYDLNSPGDYQVALSITTVLTRNAGVDEVVELVASPVTIRVN